MIRGLLVALGSLCVALGVIGIFVPLLPTTPFLLLAAALFMRSSPRMHQWLLDNRYLGSYIRNYREKRGMPLRAKVVALSLLWLTIGYSVIFFISHLALRILLLIIATAVTIHLLRLKTL